MSGAGVDTQDDLLAKAKRYLETFFADDGESPRIQWADHDAEVVALVEMLRPASAGRGAEATPEPEWRGPTRTAFGNPMPGYEEYEARRKTGFALLPGYCAEHGESMLRPYERSTVQESQHEGSAVGVDRASDPDVLARSVGESGLDVHGVAPEVAQRVSADAIPACNDCGWPEHPLASCGDMIGARKREAFAYGQRTDRESDGDRRALLVETQKQLADAVARNVALSQETERIRERAMSTTLPEAEAMVVACMQNAKVSQSEYRVDDATTLLVSLLTKREPPRGYVREDQFLMTEEWLHRAEHERDTWRKRATRWAVEARLDDDRAKEIEAKARKAMGDAIAKLLPFSDISHGDECPARFCEDNSCECPDGEEETAHRTDDLCECTVGVIVRAIDDLRFAFAPDAEVMPSSRDTQGNEATGTKEK